MKQSNILRGFEKHIPRDRRKSPLSYLAVGDEYYFDQQYSKKLYNTVYQLQKRTGKEFAYKEIINGILIKRIK